MEYTTKKLLANNAYFKTIAKTTKMYLWNDLGLVFTINEDNKFVCDTKEKKDAIRSCTTKLFYDNNTIT